MTLTKIIRTPKAELLLSREDVRLIGACTKSHYDAEVAELFADAAEAEATHLEEVGGEWGSVAAWKKSKSGVATAKAVKAALKVDPRFKLSEWM